MEREITPDTLTTDRQLFNSFVYTPLDEAIDELDRRSKDTKLEKHIEDLLPFAIPEVLQGKKSAVLFRQLVTPNYEVRRFLSIVDVVGELEPFFWEYHDDKFTSNNSMKYALGKMGFYSGKGKKGGTKMKYQKILDFISADGKKISEVKTLWGQPLTEFHRELFEKTYRPIDPQRFIDVSEYVASLGGAAKDYYKILLLLFVRHAILFENFMLEESSERSFTKDVFLPAFLEVERITGYKPLVVALEPTDIEGDDFWESHPAESHEHIKNKSTLV
jgi:hypothetical protein